MAAGRRTKVEPNDLGVGKAGKMCGFKLTNNDYLESKSLSCEHAEEMA